MSATARILALEAKLGTHVLPVQHGLGIAPHAVHLPAYGLTLPFDEMLEARVSLLPALADWCSAVQKAAEDERVRKAEEAERERARLRALAEAGNLVQDDAPFWFPGCVHVDDDHECYYAAKGRGNWDVPIKEVQDGVFHLKQWRGDEEPLDTVVCTQCGGKHFYVGSGSYYSAIKCATCEWEACIHDG